jgi:hypothetical protein
MGRSWAQSTRRYENQPYFQDSLPSIPYNRFQKVREHSKVVGFKMDNHHNNILVHRKDHYEVH